MPRQLVTHGMGLQILDPTFPLSGTLTLRILSSTPPSLREWLLFGSSRTCLPLQKAIQRFLSGPVAVRACFTEGSLEGHLFECMSSEKYFLLGSHYEPRVQRVLPGLVRPGDIVYDVGAHAGYWALLLSTLCGSTGRVFAFEPSPINFQRLKRNIELNERHSIVPLNLAVSNVQTDVLLSERGSESYIITERIASDEMLSRVPSVRLDDFVYRDHNPAPTVVKLDVEGYAGCCMAGMERILQCHRPQFLFEVHHDSEASAISRILGPHSYELRRVGSATTFPGHWVAMPR